MMRNTINVQPASDTTLGWVVKVTDYKHRHTVEIGLVENDKYGPGTSVCFFLDGDCATTIADLVDGLQAALSGATHAEPPEPTLGARGCVYVESAS